MKILKDMSSLKYVVLLYNNKGEISAHKSNKKENVYELSRMA